ncbi:hypothetical protein D3OALGA1CA_1486 [Olavius algarvensis associated proteobacterium Delta 3]|nr:hypothetical protein D3OALGB2SA_934 [Olavius algarvensis associated proteobacterium Delta 3]CAB5101740.1 hypothetical protein D3OALGA1CA_1486 [Olavius algarvensis associated proteobacterium Delta 3]
MFLRDSFSESPSQGFWEKKISFASSAARRLSFPYFCKRNKKGNKIKP